MTEAWGTEKFQAVREAALQFLNEEDIESITPFGNGHINDTYLVKMKGGDNDQAILQKMNQEVFLDIVGLMENVEMVTAYLRKKIAEEGGDPDRETMSLYVTKEGKTYYQNEVGDYYRMLHYIRDTVCLDKPRSPEDFYESGVGFGHFQYLMSGFDIEKLHETIVGFHDTAARFERFCQVVKEDRMGRASSVADEINFVMEREDVTRVLGDMAAAGQMPLRVTHNDTKLNNVMMDAKTSKAVCVIDLDTVMPGLAVNDFGDSIRFGASTAAEDETDLSKVECSMELFELYTKGFLKGCGGRLTQTEVLSLPLGAKVMTLECGMRFLTDYLEGDVYFKIHRPDHNRDRCRTQFKLVCDMEKKWDQMQEIVRRVSGL